MGIFYNPRYVASAKVLTTVLGMFFSLVQNQVAYGHILQESWISISTMTLAYGIMFNHGSPKGVHPQLGKSLSKFSQDRIAKEVHMHVWNMLKAWDLGVSSQRERNKIDRAFGLKLNITRKNQVILVCWKPSSSYILNTDGSCFSSVGAAGCAYVIRDQHGHFIQAESIFLGHVDSFTAEIMGILMGMKKCTSIGLGNVRVQTDNKPLAQMLDKGEGFPWRNYDELCEIYQIMDTYTYKVEHIYREANAVADFLAKQASSGLSIELNCASMLPRTARGLLRLDSISYP